MVVFDHDHVVQSHPVVGASSLLYGQLVEHPQSGCRFAGVKQLGVRACQFPDVPGGFGGDSRHALKDIQRKAFSQQQTAVAGFDAQDDVAFFNGVSVFYFRIPDDVFLKAFVNASGDVQAGNYAVGFHLHFRHRAGAGRDDGVGRDVTGGDIFFDSEVYQSVD